MTELLNVNRLSMDRHSAFTQTCACGRTFSQVGAFKNHQNSCKKIKKRLSNVLMKAKEVIASRKRKFDTTVTVDLPANIDNNDDALHAQIALSEVGSVPAVNSSSAAPAAILDETKPTKRRRQLPSRFRAANLELHDRRMRDILPQPLPALPPPGAMIPSSPRVELISHSLSSPDQPHNASANKSLENPSVSLPALRRILETPRNSFGLFRRYHAEKFPSHDPEGESDMPSLLDIVDCGSGYSPSPSILPSFRPYPNKCSFLLGDWYWNHSIQKSQQDFKELLKIVGADDFNPADVRETQWDKINRQLALNDWDEDKWIDEDAGWNTSPITISVPFHRLTDKPGPQNYTIAEFHHRSLVSIIREKITNPSHNSHFHYDPYEVIWQPGNGEEVRVHGELYSSPAFIDAHTALQNSPSEPGCDLPRVVVALMFWSDGTHLTNFGDAKLWPLYMFFGNESKYRRGKPSCNSCEHVAYFETLPDSFKDFASQYAGKRNSSKAFFTHCRRECMHAQWRIILDNEFLDAYEHGIVIECCDGILRRFYPRIFTYSADYPEKVLLACIRNLGGCPCPRCMVPLSKTHLVGTKKDRSDRIKLARVDDEQHKFLVSTARDLIYNHGHIVDGAAIERLLKPQSLVPTSTAFSDRLSKLGFDVFSALLVDLLHEVELGVWKALFIHLLRILQTIGERSLHELDRRFRLVPTFGRDTIRRFTSNTSELKKMAARNYEDFLQCAIPVFDGLLPEPHNTRILRLLFTFAHWHGLAKLRMHTDTTLAILDNETTALGHQLRQFESQTCSLYQTRELKREAEARIRRQLRQGPSAKSSAAASSHGQTANQRHSKTFNLQTYKVHALGDYVATIKRYGTTDSYTSHLGEGEHRRPKGRYKRTSKKKFLRQLAQIERRQARIRLIRQKLNSAKEHVSQDPESHHHIGVAENIPQHIGTFLRAHTGDPAVKGFWTKLKEHLLPRVKALLRLDAEMSPSDDCAGDSTHVDSTLELDGIHFKGDRIYRHNIMRINYTTYDVRRAQDVINPNTDHRDIMLLRRDDSSENHQYIYARVLGIYHVNVIYSGPGMSNYSARRMEFLWVRWFENLDNIPVQSSWTRSQLDRLQFPPMSEEEAFGFVDPAQVLRGCHLIPVFAAGLKHQDRGISECAQNSKDWCRYYVDRFVDRDMIMRYHWGLGVGHKYGLHSSRPNDRSSVAATHTGNFEDLLCEGDCLTTDQGGDGIEEDVEEDLAEVRSEEEYDLDDDDNDDNTEEEDQHYDDTELLEWDEMYGD